MAPGRNRNRNRNRMAIMMDTCCQWSSPEDDDFTDDSAHFGILRDTMQQIDLAHRLIDLYSEKLEMAENSTDVMRIFRAGKCASLLGAEGLHQICNSSSVLRMLHRLGVRYITLAHAKNNVYADSAVRIYWVSFALADERVLHVM